MMHVCFEAIGIHVTVFIVMLLLGGMHSVNQFSHHGQKGNEIQDAVTKHEAMPLTITLQS